VDRRQIGADLELYTAEKERGEENRAVERRQGRGVACAVIRIGQRGREALLARGRANPQAGAGISKNLLPKKSKVRRVEHPQRCSYAEIADLHAETCEQEGVMPSRWNLRS